MPYALAGIIDTRRSIADRRTLMESFINHSGRETLDSWFAVPLRSVVTNHSSVGVPAWEEQEQSIPMYELGHVRGTFF